MSKRSGTYRLIEQFNILSRDRNRLIIMRKVQLVSLRISRTGTNVIQVDQKGIHITIASSVIFGFALWIYLASGISNFMPAMQEISQLPEGVGALQVAMVAFFETLATGVIISFVLMQVMKRKIGESRKERSKTVHA